MQENSRGSELAAPPVWVWLVRTCLESTFNTTEVCVMINCMENSKNTSLRIKGHLGTAECIDGQWQRSTVLPHSHCQHWVPSKSREVNDGIVTCSSSRGYTHLFCSCRCFPTPGWSSLEALVSGTQLQGHFSDGTASCLIEAPTHFTSTIHNP